MKYTRPEIETARLAPDKIESRFQKRLSFQLDNVFFATNTSYEADE